MNILHSSYYFPAQFKLRKLRNITRKNTHAETPEPLKVKKYELGNFTISRARTEQRTSRNERKAKNSLASPDGFSDNFSFCLENYAVTNLPPFEVIEHYNVNKRDDIKERLGAGRNRKNLCNYTFTPVDFPIGQLDKIEKELFSTSQKKKVKKIIKLGKPKANEFKVVGNQVNIKVKKVAKKPRIRSKAKDIKCPEVKLNSSHSFKSSLL